MLQYETYRLSRIIQVQGIISADLVSGLLPPGANHIHKDAWELCCCLEQEIHVLKNGILIPVQSGQLVLVPPGVVHDVIVEKPDARAFVIAFSCSSSENLRALQDTVFQGEAALQNAIQQMIAELESSFIHDADKLKLYRFYASGDAPLGAEQMICNHLEQILITLLRKATMHRGQIVPSGKFREAIQSYLAEQVNAYIQEHIQEKLTVEQIASYFHYSRARLSTIYKTVTGRGINETIAAERLARAKKLLQQQELTITQISDLLGYSSPQYFSQKFSLETGCPPSKYAAEFGNDSH